MYASMIYGRYNYLQDGGTQLMIILSYIHVSYHTVALQYVIGLNILRLESDEVDDGKL